MLGLPTSVWKQAPVGSIQNAFGQPVKLAVNLTAIGDPPSRPPLEERRSADKKKPMAVMDPALHGAKRVAVCAAEYAANYINLYEGELEDDDYAAGSKDMQAECDEIAAAGRLVNRAGRSFARHPSRQIWGRLIRRRWPPRSGSGVLVRCRFWWAILYSALPTGNIQPCARVGSLCEGAASGRAPCASPTDGNPGGRRYG